MLSYNSSSGIPIAKRIMRKEKKLIKVFLKSNPLRKKL
jgi:hypothetical protein